ncbi:hypothetical protein GCM10010306_084370 [Streptomyces umbrinus]|nr:hypothetical protein GCM10010306_084370 [Streptomyces umbrinus]
MGWNVRDQFAPAVPVDRKPHHIADVACHPSGVEVPELDRPVRVRDGQGGAVGVHGDPVDRSRPKETERDSTRAFLTVTS